MAYPQFALMTLQLIAPTTNMTLQEYKDAYGIDLTKTDIHAFKLVLFNNEKYAIDQIKDVEGGHEIYFNGHILSITDIVQTSDEVYDVANAKPIYLHPVVITFSTGTRASLFIFDNTSTAYDEEGLIAKIVSIAEATADKIARIPMSGAIVISDEVQPISYLAYTKASAQFQLFAGNTSNTYNGDQLRALISSVNDSVNKIN